MIVAKVVANWLADRGISHAFGVVGGGNVALWDAVDSLGKTEIVSCHHEQAAAQAAIYYYRASNRIPLCLVTTGAGSANSLTGVLNAWMDSIPLFVISGNEPYKLWKDRDQRVIGTQGYDSAAFVRPITKGAWTHTTAFKVKPLLDFAIEKMTSGRPGPVWIDIPKDVQTWDEA
jgi:acetolactate synthase-1/2/3 large subunit